MKHITLFFKMLLSIIVPYSTDYTISLLDTDNLSHDYISNLRTFESEFSYPFSDTEQFTIQHGNDGNFFAFFEYLGKPYYFVAHNKKDKTIYKAINNKYVPIKRYANEIAGASCAILRTLKTKQGKSKKAWYICDLKVGTKYQDEHLSLTMIKNVAGKRFLQCPRGFGICMNPPSGEPKAARIFKLHGPFKDMATETLHLYTLTKTQALQHQGSIKDSLVQYGYMKPSEKIAYTSTTGMKDYQIFNATSSRPWNLLHIHPSNTASLPQEDAAHMICAVKDSALDNAFKSFLGSPSSTAQIISYNMEDFDFNFLTTNQI